MIILSLLVSCLVHAAPHAHFPDSVSYTQVKDLLLNSEQIKELKDLGPQGYKQLRDIMLSQDESMDLRWSATLAIARIGGSESQPDIDLALSSPVWFMRSAGLLASSLIDKDKAVEKAKNFLRHDRALMVRATALQIVSQAKKVDRDFLWAEMYNPLNFDKGQSLSLRLSLLKILSDNTEKNESSKFAALTRDNHPEIQLLAKKVIDTRFMISKNSTLDE